MVAPGSRRAINRAPSEHVRAAHDLPPGRMPGEWASRRGAWPYGRIARSQPACPDSQVDTTSVRRMISLKAESMGASSARVLCVSSGLAELGKGLGANRLRGRK